MTNSENATLIRLNNVGMRFDNRDILSDINLAVNEGDFIAVTGPNGGGKTTLLRIILKLQKPSVGSVDYNRNLRIGYLPQKNMIDSKFPITVRELVASGLLGRDSRNLPTAERESRIRETLRIVALEDRANQPIGELSGGQLQRSLLGRAIISEPSVLVLDEPLSYLDKQFEHRFYDLLKDLSKCTTIILVSHEMSVIADIATRHLIIDHTLHECTAHHHFVPPQCN